jgi:putative phosphoesterase
LNKPATSRSKAGASPSKATALRVGILSDTHGLLRPEARTFLVGCDYIVHGGDIGSAAILDTLSAIAPLTAVRGNNDTGTWARRLRETELIRLGCVFAYVIHDIASLDIDLKAAQLRVVVSGHSHVPKIQERDGVLFVNPGSCGPRRFRLPISVGEILISGTEVRARTVELVPAPQ